jgi:hypothetical protein
MPSDGELFEDLLFADVGGMVGDLGLQGDGQLMAIGAHHRQLPECPLTLAAVELDAVLRDDGIYRLFRFQVFECAGPPCD